MAADESVHQGRDPHLFVVDEGCLRGEGPLLLGGEEGSAGGLWGVACGALYGIAVPSTAEFVARAVFVLLAPRRGRGHVLGDVPERGEFHVGIEERTGIGLATR